MIVLNISVFFVDIVYHWIKDQITSFIQAVYIYLIYYDNQHYIVLLMCTVQH